MKCTDSKIGADRLENTWGTGRGQIKEMYYRCAGKEDWGGAQDNRRETEQMIPQKPRNNIEPIYNKKLK